MTMTNTIYKKQKQIQIIIYRGVLRWKIFDLYHMLCQQKDNDNQKYSVLTL